MVHGLYDPKHESNRETLDFTYVMLSGPGPPPSLRVPRMMHKNLQTCKRFYPDVFVVKTAFVNQIFPAKASIPVTLCREVVSHNNPAVRWWRF